MSRTTSTKDENLHLRASASEKAHLAEAARLSGTTVSRFVLEASLRLADEVVERETRVRLSPEAHAAFFERLDDAPREIPALRELLTKPPFFE